MSLSRSLSKYTAITRINLQSNLAYVREVVFRSVFMLVILYVFIQLWTATYNTVGSTSIAGLTLSDTIWYLVLTETIMLSKIRFAGKISEEVKDGSLAYTIGRPYSYLLYGDGMSMGRRYCREVKNALFEGRLEDIVT